MPLPTQLRLAMAGGAALARHLPPVLMGARHSPPSKAKVAREFFGLNVASSPDPACDDFVVDRLRALGITQVRIDLTYTCFGSFVERFTRRLLDEHFVVMAHLVQPPLEAHGMVSDPSAQNRWSDFVSRVCESFGGRTLSIEIGTTPNRRRWSGYSYAGYLRAFEIAFKIARAYGMEIAGPNISDFEPLYNLIFLSLLRAHGCLPDIHTDNLFVERMIEPEAYDSRAAGKLGARLLGLDLVGKANLLKSISDRFLIGKTYCTHVSWSSRRIGRLQDAIEDKQADYLVRYLLLAASSGALARVYWGPIVGHREGLVDDAVSAYPCLPRVVLFERLYGDVRNYRERPAFAALALVVRLLSGSECSGRSVDQSGPRVLEFTHPDGKCVHAVWMRDRRFADLRTSYSETTLRGAEILDREGNEISARDATLSERPIFLIWRERGCVQPITADGEENRSHISVFSTPRVRFVPYGDASWRGTIVLESDKNRDQRLRSLLPDSLERVQPISILRNSRNRVYLVSDPTRLARCVVIKRSRESALASLAPRLQRSNALLGWNNACEMLRRGVSTPIPIAFFEPVTREKSKFSYFLCEYIAEATSAREIFDAFASGKVEYRGFQKRTLYSAIANFLVKMHTRGVFHRDLSAGNLLLKAGDRDDIDVIVIDTSRARFFDRPLGRRRRVSDLMRLCHPLDWQNRRELVGLYFELLGTALGHGWRMPFTYYDWKHIAKRRLRGAQTQFLRMIQ